VEGDRDSDLDVRFLSCFAQPMATYGSERPLLSRARERSYTSVKAKPKVGSSVRKGC
jgi:hypothetical protein